MSEHTINPAHAELVGYIQAENFLGIGMTAHEALDQLGSDRISTAALVNLLLPEIACRTPAWMAARSKLFRMILDPKIMKFEPHHAERGEPVKNRFGTVARPWLWSSSYNFERRAAEAKTITCPSCGHHFIPEEKA